MKRSLVGVVLVAMLLGSVSAQGQLARAKGKLQPGGPIINMVKCLYSDGHCSGCVNDPRGDWMCGAWLGGWGVKVPCDAPCAVPTPVCTHVGEGSCNANCEAICSYGVTVPCQNLNSFCYRGRALVSASCCSNNTRGGFFIRNQVPGCWFQVGSQDRTDVWLNVQADPSGTVNVDFLPIGATVYIWRVPDGAAGYVTIESVRQEVFLR